jgi:hypothetical protein
MPEPGPLWTCWNGAQKNPSSIAMHVCRAAIPRIPRKCTRVPWTKQFLSSAAHASAGIVILLIRQAVS